MSRDLVLPTLVMASEAIVLSLWFRIVLALLDVPLPPFLYVLVPSLVACIGVRLLQFQPDGIRTAFGILGGLIVCFLMVTAALGPTWPFDLRDWVIDPLLTLPTPIAYLFIAAVCWFRGVRVAMKPIDTMTVEEAFQMNGLGLVAGSIFAGLMANAVSSEPVSDVPLSAIAFFTTGLASLAIARLRLLRQSGPTTAGTTQRWLITTGFTIAGILVVAVIIAAITPGPLGGLGGLLAPLVPFLRFLDPIFMILLYPIALLMERILVGLAGMMINVSQLLAAMAGIPQPNPDDAQLQLPPPEEIQAVIRSFEWGVVLFIAAAFGLVIWLLLRRRRVSSTVEVEEERETVWSWREFFSMLLARFRAWRKKPAADALGTLAEPPQSAEARSVRALYRQFLHDAARLGKGRPVGFTPYEFVQSHHFPAPATDLTELYVRVRYGPDHAEESDVSTARTYLQEITTQMAASGTNGVPHS